MSMKRLPTAGAASKIVLAKRERISAHLLTSFGSVAALLLLAGCLQKHGGADTPCRDEYAVRDPETLRCDCGPGSHEEDGECVPDEVEEEDSGEVDDASDLDAATEDSGDVVVSNDAGIDATTDPLSDGAVADAAMVDAADDGGHSAQVAAGNSHTCAVIESGDVWCWGANGSGQLGDGPRTNSLVPTRVPDIRARFVAASSNKTCAVLVDGRVSCWGALAQTLNLAMSEYPVDLVFPPTTVDGVEDAVSVAVGVFEQCALLASGDVTCWDWKDFSQEFVPPSKVAGVAGAVQIAAAYRDTCAVLSDGKVKCWALSLQAPPAERGGGGVRSVALGGSWCVLLRSGTVQCAGNNNSGQLGDGTTTQSEMLVSVLGLSKVQRLAVGDQHACAAPESGEVFCWGNPTGFGGLTGAVTMPKRIQVSNVVDVAAGKQHTCVALRSGDVMCWGANGAGQVGDGTTIFAPKPLLVSGLR
jgi:alpha-tubulin suppressor-like RCC1 family protein